LHLKIKTINKTQMTSNSNKYFMGLNSKVIDSFEIERRSNLSYEVFERDYLSKRKPVIITDAIENWKASEWTPEWFKENYPETILNTDEGEMSMKDFIDAITSESNDPGPFLREKPLEELFPDLIRHVAPTPIYANNNWLSSNFKLKRLNGQLNRLGKIEVNFCGKRIFPYLHIDNLQSFAFISQLYGEKHVVVYPPNQEHLLYRDGEVRASKIYDVEKPDLITYPLFAQTKPTKFILYPGESVYMPNGWWHTTRVYGASLSTVYSVVNANNWNDMTKDFINNIGLSAPKAKVIEYYLKFFKLTKSNFN